MKQFMVRIMRDSDEEYADIVVDALSGAEASAKALKIVEADPNAFFGEPETPQFYVDPSSEVEDVTGGEFMSITSQA